jgi:predicted MFS family arabinose efflux permease
MQATDHQFSEGGPPQRRRLANSYRWLLAATATSAVGDGLVLVGFPLMATTISERPLLVAGITIAGRLPWLLTALPAGALADRVDRRTLLTTVEIVRALVLLALGLDIAIGDPTLPVLYLAAFAIGALETAFAAAVRACIPNLVEARDLPRANGYVFAADSAGEQFAGPALGGVAFRWSTALPFLGDAVSFAGSAVLLAVALPKSERRHAARTSTLSADIRVGLKWFRAQPLIRLLAAIVASFAFCQTAVLSILVVYGLRELQLSKPDYGLFLAVGAVGDVGGSLLAHRIHAHLGATKAIFLAGVAAAAGYLLLASTTNVGAAVTGYALEAAAVALGNVTTMSLRHRIIPTELFGRVNNAFRMCVWGVVPLGALAGGVLASQSTLRTTFLIAGITQLTIIALIARRLAREVRKVADHDGHD